VGRSLCFDGGCAGVVDAVIPLGGALSIEGKEENDILVQLCPFAAILDFRSDVCSLDTIDTHEERLVRTATMKTSNYPWSSPVLRWQEDVVLFCS